MLIDPVTSGASLLNEMQALAAEATAIQPADTTVTSGVTGSTPVDFSSFLTTAVNKVNQEQLDATARMQAMEMGSNQDLVGTMISTQKAGLSFSALVQVRNKVMTGLDNIMEMSL